MQELMKRVNSDSVFLEDKKTGRNATYNVHVEREPENGIESDLRFGFEVIGDRMKEVWSGGERTTELTDLVFSGKYGVWVDLLTGKLALSDALLTRKLVLRGETDEIYGPTVWMSPGPIFGMSLTAAAERIVEVARTIPTEFHGKYSHKPLGL
jgi:hypothetical protein